MTSLQFDDGVIAQFELGPGQKKYKAILYVNGQKWKSVTFGDRNYQQYEDKTPLKLYKDLDHHDEARRLNYQQRQGANGYQNIKYSPAWFSWYFLW